MIDLYVEGEFKSEEEDFEEDEDFMTEDWVLIYHLYNMYLLIL
jgi:hypothetical protein